MSVHIQDSSLFTSTHRENKARMNLGGGHLFLLAQVQKQFVLRGRGGALFISIKSHTSNPKQVTSQQSSYLFCCVVAQSRGSQLALLHVLAVNTAQDTNGREAFCCKID